MSASTPYKPSPLGYGSPNARNSPFRRPESPASPSPAPLSIHRPGGVTTPNSSPTKQPQHQHQSSASYAHSRLGSISSSPPVSPVASNRTTPRLFGGGGGGRNKNSDEGDSYFPSPQQQQQKQQHLGSPVMMSRTATTPQPSSATSNGNALSQLQPAQVRTLREGFQILDRNSDGVVTREDVADMLDQLGLPSNQTELSKFFPPSSPQSMTLAVFINSIATNLAAMSPSTELLSAFSAFDDDDSGQVDLAELRDALLTTAPEPGERSLTPGEVDRIMQGFSGRRAFSKTSIMNHHGGLVNGGGQGGGATKRGEVFKYQDFVQSIVGTGKENSEAASSSNDGSED